jgi:hypothetical protein
MKTKKQFIPIALIISMATINIQAMKRGTNPSSNDSNTNVASSPNLKRRKLDDKQSANTNNASTSSNNSSAEPTQALDIVGNIAPAAASHSSPSIFARLASGLMSLFGASKSPDEQALDKINHALEVNETEQNNIKREIAAQTATFKTIKAKSEQRIHELSNQKKELRADDTLRKLLLEKNRIETSIKNARARLNCLQKINNRLRKQKNTIQEREYEKTIRQSQQAIQQSEEYMLKLDAQSKQAMENAEKQLDEAEAQNNQLCALLSQHLPNDNDDIDCKPASATTTTSSSSSSTSTATQATNANADDNSLTPEGWALLNATDQKNVPEDKKTDKK